LGNRFSKDDQYVGYASKRDEFGIWQTLDRGPVHLLTSPVLVRSQISYSRRWPSLAISATSDGVELWDTCERQLLGRLPSGVTTSAVLLPDESAIMSCGPQGVLRWPIDVTDSTWRIGHPQTISPTATAKLEVEANGQAMVALQGHTIVVFDLSESTPTASELGVHPGAHQVFISPDGKWIVSTTWQMGSGIWIWDRASGERVKELEKDMGAATAAFSPDGQWLATCVWRNLAVWKTGTWERQAQVERPADDDWSPALAFSSNSKMFATLFSRRSIQLLDTMTGQRLAIIESSDPGMIGDVEFNSTGNILGAVSDRRLLIWNLGQLHEQLSLIHLGWESFMIPPEADLDVGVPHVEIAAFD
jgi:WD40 repeat protein